MANIEGGTQSLIICYMHPLPGTPLPTPLDLELGSGTNIVKGQEPQRPLFNI